MNLVALNGSPVRGSNVDVLLEQVCSGYRQAGGNAEHIHCSQLLVRPCVACGPEPTTGYCIFHDDMDAVYARLEQADTVVVGSPVYFDSVSAQLKLVIDRCNCITPLVRLGDSYGFRPKWARTRRGVFVTAHSSRHPYEMAERCVRGFMKWIGVKWEETLDYAHEDEGDVGSVLHRPEWLERARAVGERLAKSAPLEVRA